MMPWILIVYAYAMLIAYFTIRTVLVHEERGRLATYLYLRISFSQEKLAQNLKYFQRIRGTFDFSLLI